MSIPPLVCSTPPPPDQCEEDREPEDFDLHYNLSQDDEEDENNDYNYGNLSTFKHFDTQPHYHNEGISQIFTELNQATQKNEVDSAPHSLIEPPSELTNVLFVAPVVGTTKNETIPENSLKCDEDNNIEDLDLKLEECTAAPNDTINDENDTKEYDINAIVKEENMIISSKNSVVDEQPISVLEDQHEVGVNSYHGDESEFIDDGIIDVQPNNTGADRNDDVICHKHDISPTEYNKDSNEQETVLDNDFDDFDDFQFSSPKIKSNVIIESDNPWEKKIDEDGEFSNFTANFDQTGRNYNTTDTSINITYDESEEHTHNISPNISEDDDDFGDFDDFKSSSAANVTKLDISPEEPTGHSCEVPVLNLELSDKGHQILDSVNQVLNTIFLDDIVEPDCEFESKLETLLSETWGHLRETDIRQPYIVNWNNSLGQKILLRALCIDSRNILFGPKWSHSMPKYAVTLSTAPLQPQRPVLQSSASQIENTSVEKAPNKTCTWSDPFTSDGQESCNNENEVSSIERKPAHMEVFESSLPTKPDNIYPAKVSVQPLRQISLPDTHIFTPTDSETPRSKTIHYDTGPTVLIPENSNSSHTFHSEKSILEPETNTELQNVEDNDYWEFQDFKTTPKMNITVASIGSEATSVPLQLTSTGDNQNNLNKSYQGELLQPVKISPVVPKLNWPNPGEVKEVFDDFTDFVSNSFWSKDTDSVQLQNDSHVTECKTVDNTNDKDKNTHTNETKAIQPSLPDSLDDEFDTFQYALPIQNKSEIPNIANINIIRTNKLQCFSSLIANQKSNSDEAFSRLNVDSKISASRPRQDLPLPKNMLSVANATEGSSGHHHSPQFMSPLSQSNILQPIPASSNSHQKTGQILQPLSLESYSQLNWPSPGIDLQDLSRFNPVESLHSLKTDLSNSSLNYSSPLHNQKNSTSHQAADDELWGEFISSKPRPQPSMQKKNPNLGEDDEWTDFVSSPSVKPQNGLNTISFNVHSNSNMHKNSYQNKLAKNSQSIDIPTLNYITPKGSNHKSCNERHFQNL